MSINKLGGNKITVIDENNIVVSRAQSLYHINLTEKNYKIIYEGNNYQWINDLVYLPNN